MSVNEKMTALADEVRELSGVTDKLGIDEMTVKIGDANTEIDEQASLLVQAVAALNGKATGGGSADPILQNKTVTPTTSQQTVTADSGYDGLDTVTVNAIPNSYVKPSATKAAATYTPGTSNQTIAAGTYLSGTQTIKGDTNLKAANIASGVSIFGIAGTHSGGENLDSVLSEQQTLLNTLTTVLNNKASGGGNNMIEVSVSNVSYTYVTIYYYNENLEFVSETIPHATDSKKIFINGGFCNVSGYFTITTENASVNYINNGISAIKFHNNGSLRINASGGSA